MPWCPKCKNEYRDGFTVCNDCGTPLVASLEDVKYRPLCHFNNDEAYSKFLNYLSYSKIKSYPVYIDDVDYLGFDDDSYSDAKKALFAFVKVEGNIACVKQIDDTYFVDLIDTEEVINGLNKLKEVPDQLSEILNEDGIDAENNSEAEEKEADEEEFDALKELVYGSGSTVYESKKTKAEEMSGSGYMLIVIGIGGAVFVVLHMLGLISIIQTQLFSYIMMLFTFVAMAYWGFHSLKKSKEYEADAVQEEQLSSYIKEWMKQNISADDIKSADMADNGPEENFLLRLDYIKNRMTKEVPELKSLDDVYLDAMIEEYYNSLFDE